jgi:exopolysaccharide production protein ExoY
MSEVTTTEGSCAQVSGPVLVPIHTDTQPAETRTAGRAKILSSHRKKRIFDYAVVLSVAPFWLPVLAVCAGLILLLEGRPVFYVSQRQVGRGKLGSILKFRTMQRNADKILNRDTVPVVHTVFLNIPRDSSVYTPVGRIIERLALTELPQLLHVLSGQMSLIGSRPLPKRVMDILRSRHSVTEDRFLTQGGLTGPVQLVGRDAISDAERLGLEADYCRIAASDAYRMRLDVWLLLYTVVVVIAPRRLMTAGEVRNKMYQIVGLTVNKSGMAIFVPLLPLLAMS